MKILIIQENGRHDKNRNFRECFSMQRALRFHKQECNVWGLGHDNYSTKPDFNSYDFIINLENYDETGWVPDLSKITTYKLLWVIDEHCRGSAAYIYEFQRGVYNKILQATKDFLTPNSVWFPNCYDDTLIQPRIVPIRADVGFCGNVINRGPFLNILKQHFRFIPDVMAIGEDMINAICSYKVHFNFNIANDINYRNFETIGCKVPLVTNYNPQYLDLGFKDSENCMIYKTIPELIEKIKLLLSDEVLRNNIAEAGLVLAQKHTYTKRAEHLIKFLNTTK